MDSRLIGTSLSRDTVKTEEKKEEKMANRAMMFNTEMVEAILQGRKTQTRRVGERRPAEEGDLIAVRETHCVAEAGRWKGWHVVDPGNASQACYFRAGWSGEETPRWRPSIQMPGWATRIVLVVRSVRRERLQQMTEEDARQEGVTTKEGQGAREAFEELWERVYGGRGEGWESNPLVWAVEFRVMQVRGET